MIHEVDDAIATLVRREVLEGSAVTIDFEVPNRDWAARRTGPTINVFLYEIKEDLERRHVAYRAETGDEGRVTSRRQPTRHYKLSYLVTAWTQRPRDEHRLLSAALSLFASYEALPVDVLPDGLRDAPTSYVMTIAWPPTEDRLVSDVWTALGGDLKPSLDLTIVAPLITGRRYEVGPPVLEHPRLAARAGEGEPEIRTRSDNDTGADERPVEERFETFQGGTDEQPGRVFRVRTPANGEAGSDGR